MNKVVYQKLEELKDKSVRLEVKKGDCLEYVFSALTPGDFALDVSVVLHGNARARILGAVLTGLSNSVRINVVTYHQGPASTSQVLVKGVVGKASYMDFKGLIKIDPQAQKTEAYLENRILLLDKPARANTEPALEINANDVKASHGATIGPIKPEQLFYLQSRGLQLEEAQELLTVGFLEAVADRVEDKAVQDQLRYEISRRFGADKLKV